MIENPYETKSDSFYFVNDKLIMHNKASYRVCYFFQNLEFFSSYLFFNSILKKTVHKPKKAMKINLERRLVMLLNFAA